MLKRDLWKGISGLVSLSNYPTLPCPYCSSQGLTIDKSSIRFKELSGAALNEYVKRSSFSTLSSAEKVDNSLIKFIAVAAAIASEFNYKPSQFVAFFTCSMCGQSVSALGMAKVPLDDRSETTQIKVENFNPPVPMFDLSPTTPESINKELIASFSYFHSDTCSSGHRLRRAIEKLCAELGFKERNLHRSIESMSKVHAQESKWLRPLKLIGNEATHGEGVTEEELLDSYQVFEVVLDIFRRKEVEELTNQAVARLELRAKPVE